MARPLHSVRILGTAIGGGNRQREATAAGRQIRVCVCVCVGSSHIYRRQMAYMRRRRLRRSRAEIIKLIQDNNAASGLFFIRLLQRNLPSRGILSKGYV